MKTSLLFTNLLQSILSKSNLNSSDKLSSLHDDDNENSLNSLSCVLDLISVRANVSLPEIDTDMTIEHVSNLFDSAEKLEAGESFDNFIQIVQGLNSCGEEPAEDVDGEPFLKPNFFNKDFVASQVMDDLRLSIDTDTISMLNHRFGLDQILESYKPTKDDKRLEQADRAIAIRLTPRMNSRIHSLLDKALNALGNPFEVALFIENSPHLNASADCEYIIDADCKISITSRAIELLNDNEMLFLLGHEIGHHYYGHFYSGGIVPMAYGGEHSMPELLKLKLNDWGRYGEFSADRCGFAATGYNRKATMSAFFKIECGLGPEHINVDEKTILDAVSDIKKMNSPDILSFESHPLSPLRAYAINSLSKALDESADVVGAVEIIEKEAIELAQMSDFQDMTEENQHIRNLIAAGGLILAKADGDELIEGGDLNTIVAMLADYSSSPEELLKAIGSIDRAIELVNESGAWLSENVGAERFHLYEALADIAVMDGECTEGELQFLMDLAELLFIPGNWVNKMLETKLHSGLPANLMSAVPAISLR